MVLIHPGVAALGLVGAEAGGGALLGRGHQALAAGPRVRQRPRAPAAHDVLRGRRLAFWYCTPGRPFFGISVCVVDDGVKISRT